MEVDRIAALLTPEKFEAWLKCWPDDAIVGFPGEDDCCPIVCYLRDVSGEDARIEAAHDPGRFYMPLPGWVIRFINRIDDRRRPLWAKTALRILHEVQ